jgi:aerobic-type carbon monoxide dehydrogenase small subunit (CoxS/CutS family)
MVMAAEGLLRENATPSEGEIRRGMAANICRCTGYVKIIESVQSAAAELSGKAGAA